MFKHTFYQLLAAGRDTFLKRVAEDVAPKLGMADEWRGVISLTGSNSARPGYLRTDMIRRIAEGACGPTGLDAIGENIRQVVKEAYGDHYDAVSFCTCEAALWASLETLAAPSMVGPGAGDRTRYIGLHELYAQHHLSYGRPTPPLYKDFLSDRLQTAGELGVLGRRLSGLDVVIVPVAGARYEVHGIKPSVVSLLTDADPAATGKAVQEVIEGRGSPVTAITTLGYETTGFGRGAKADDGTAALMVAMGEIARRYGVPYIVDKARGVPFLGSHPDAYSADVVLFSMDKVAGALTSGLAIGREDRLIGLRRAMGVHSERFGGSPPHGKGRYAAFDPGREALVSQLAALEWIRDNTDLIEANAERLHQIAVEAFAALSERYPSAILIENTVDTGGVEINYTRTWNGDGFGIPLFTNEDAVAGTNLIANGLAQLGIHPPGGEEGNLIVTPERGLLDEDGVLIEDRARVALTGLAQVLEVLSKMVEE
jgi:hypothetical protein